MAWPKLRYTPVTELAFQAHLNPSLAGSFYIEDKTRWVRNFPHLAAAARREILLKLDGFRDLPFDVREKLAVMSQREMQRLVELWRSIEDCLLLSTPEFMSCGEIPSGIWRLWRWVTCTGVHNIDNVTTIWKGFCVHLKQVAGGHSPLKPIPFGLPFRKSDGGIGVGWYKLLPWLFTIHNEVPEKDTITRLMHLASSRGLPPPSLTAKRLEVEYDGFRARLTREWPIHDKIASKTYEVGAAIGRFIKGSEIPSRAHVSLSGSASLGNPRNLGGRGVEFCRHFLHRLKPMSPSTLPVDQECWFGARYRVFPGKSWAQTMCREYELRDIRFLESNFSTEFQMIGVTPDSEYNVEEPIFGLDTQLGYQFLQHSIEVGLSEGWLEGSPFVDPLNPLRVSKTTPPTVRAEPIGEPGNKIRWITVAPAEMTVLLQPLAHELAAILEKHPMLSSGFLRSAKGWDLASHLAWKSVDLSAYSWLSGDLEAASDNMTHEYTRRAMHGLLDGSGRNHRFLHLLVDLLCSSRRVVRKWKHKEDEMFISSSAVLMGDPGTKVAIALNFLVSYEIAVRTFPHKSLSDAFSAPRVKYEWEVGESAGDDFAICGPPEFLRRLISIILLMGPKIQTEKVVVSKRLVFYCEECLIVRGKRVTGWSIPLQNCNYDETSHVDALKVRLFSPSGVVTPGETGEGFQNPAFGKGSALRNKLDWLQGSFALLVPQFQARWILRMSKFLDLSDPLLGVPIFLGGKNCPLPKSLVRANLPKLLEHPIFLDTAARVFKGNGSYFDRKILISLSQGTSFRGLEMTLREQAHLQYVMASQLVGKGFPLSELLRMAGYDDTVARRLKYRQQLKVAASIGYMSESDMELAIEKAWVIKSLFQQAAKLRPIESPTVRNARDWPKLLSSFEDAYLMVAGLEYKLPEITRDDRHLLVSALTALEKPNMPLVTFIHRSYLNAAFTMTDTPLPAQRQDRGYVRGTYRDPV
jgi:hypothetical protein